MACRGDTTRAAARLQSQCKPSRTATHPAHCVHSPFINCAGEGLFVGNSMPIRDLDMYAAPAPPCAAAVQGVAPVALGARVAANRGASGIDGVLSTGGWWAVSGEGTPAELACLFACDSGPAASLSSNARRAPGILTPHAYPLLQPPALRTGWAGAPPWLLATCPSFMTSTGSTCCAAVGGHKPRGGSWWTAGWGGRGCHAASWHLLPCLGMRSHGSHLHMHHQPTGALPS